MWFTCIEFTENGLHFFGSNYFCLRWNKEMSSYECPELILTQLPMDFRISLLRSVHYLGAWEFGVPVMENFIPATMVWDAIPTKDD